MAIRTCTSTAGIARWRIAIRGTGSELNPLFPLALNAAINNGEGPLGEAAEEEASAVGHEVANAAMSEIEPLIQRARDLFPNMTGTQLHHVVSDFLLPEGDKMGTVAELPTAYHQMITNLVRIAWPYGQGPAPEDKLQDILQWVYSQLPVDPFTFKFKL